MTTELTTELKQQLRQLEHQAVRDLAWCCFSAPLMRSLNASSVEIFPRNSSALWPWLKRLDAQPEPLEQLLSTRQSTRLGLYYETLWRFYFKHHENWELLAYNQQVHRQGITLGAFDFLCKQAQHYWHLETAVKFYLCSADTAEKALDWSAWIGPDKSDRLDIKLAHLERHQLPLRHQTQAATWLQETFPDAHTWRSGLCLQGYFFHRDSSHRPAQAHPLANFGLWFHLRELEELIPSIPQEHWLLLERQAWLAPAQTRAQEKLLNNNQLLIQAQNHVGNWHRPLLIARLVFWEDTKLWQEAQRYFLVPDDWPEQASV